MGGDTYAMDAPHKLGSEGALWYVYKYTLGAWKPAPSVAGCSALDAGCCVG